MSDQATQLRGLMQQAESPKPHAGADITRVNPLTANGDHRSATAELPLSSPTGAVSYGPICSRELVTPRHYSISPPRARSRPASETPAPATMPRPARLARAIAVASGKGGVGKSNLAVNLAVAMSQLGLKVCLLDADLGLANADLLCNLSPRLTLEQVVSGKCRLADAMLLAPGGFRLIPGASGVARLADLHASHRHAIVEQLAALERVVDVMLIDCGAGISANVVGFAAAANIALVATTPEPTAITDGYGMIQVLSSEAPRLKVQLVVNMAASEAEGSAVYGRINRVCRTFLNQSLIYGGTIPSDSAVPAAVRQRVPFVLFAPDNPATHAIRRLARALAGVDSPDTAEPVTNNGNHGFFSRLASWLGIVEYVDSTF